jgi:hypothetical protein
MASPLASLQLCLHETRSSLSCSGSMKGVARPVCEAPATGLCTRCCPSPQSRSSAACTRPSRRSSQSCCALCFADFAQLRGRGCSGCLPGPRSSGARDDPSSRRGGTAREGCDRGRSITYRR